MADVSSLLNKLLEPFFGLDIAGTYQSASQFIDFVLYLIFFISITRFTLASRFDAKTQKPISIIVGIALTIGMSFFGRRWGFSIGDLAPLAGLLFLVVLGMMFFKLLKDMGDSAPGAGAFAFLLIFFSITAIVPGFYSWIIQKVPFLEALLSIAVILAVFIAVRDMFGFIRGNESGADEDMGIRDSREYLEKKVQAEQKKRKAIAEAERQEAERRQKEAEAKREAEPKRETEVATQEVKTRQAGTETAQTRTTEAQTPQTSEEKIATERITEAKKTKTQTVQKKADKKTADKKIETSRKKEKKLINEKEKIEKKQLKLIKKTKAQLRDFRLQFRKLTHDDSGKENYNKLSDKEKKIYESVEKYACKDLKDMISALDILENKEIDDLKFFNSLKFSVGTTEKAPFYKTIVWDDNIIKEKHNLIQVANRLCSVLQEDLSKRNKLYHIRGVFSRMIRLIEKLEEINKDQLERIKLN
ncbi:MAG: hypothetical protein U9R34_00915 [Nanoarchaeota archaeon]|nr:hypothetical protein [Nanoarchaeota archaeon]